MFSRLIFLTIIESIQHYLKDNFADVSMLIFVSKKIHQTKDELAMLMMGVQVDGLRKHPNGRVDQLEDRYLGMVEAPSSNLGTSTLVET